jgi:hypothetical protein
MASLTQGWYNVYITDRTGKKFFDNTCSPMALNGVLRNLDRHMDGMKKYPGFYPNIHIATARIVYSQLTQGTRQNKNSITQEDLDMLDAIKG